MLISHFSKHIFWSYKKDADLPDDLVIRRVILHGELKDIQKLTRLYDKKRIHSVLKTVEGNKKRIHFVEKVFL